MKSLWNDINKYSKGTGSVTWTTTHLFVFGAVHGVVSPSYPMPRDLLIGGRWHGRTQSYICFGLCAGRWLVDLKRNGYGVPGQILLLTTTKPKPEHKLTCIKALNVHANRKVLRIVRVIIIIIVIVIVITMTKKNWVTHQETPQRGALCDFKTKKIA